MTGIRRAFLWASIGRYLVMAINLAATLILARLLTPADYGISVLGAAVFAIAEAIRALGGGAYLIQQKELAPENIRTSFTVSLLVTLVLTAALVLSAGPLTRYFDTPDLARYLQVSSFAYLTGPIVYPISALMSRQMAFGRIALIGVVTACLSAAVSLYLAVMGFGYMSFAWGTAISAVGGMLLYLYSWRDWRIFRPILREWRSVIAFGAYDSATAVLSQIGESVPYLILGRILNAEAIGLGQRAVLLCLFPERVILAGVGAVALPAFSQQVRDGKSLKDNYLRAIELITAAQWPALILLVLLAGPIVALLLGPQWQDAVPLVEIIGTALLFSFPISLHYPTLVAVGAIRYLPPVVVVQAIVSIGLLSFLARYGLQAAALSTLLIVPFNGLLSLLLVRYFVVFRWAELAASMFRSVLCAAASAVGPLSLMALEGRPLSIWASIVAVALSTVGWVAGLWLTRHPLLHEARRAGAAFRKSGIAVKLMRFAARQP
ncbi:MAG TPA: oligosaccharide flippase family protein [Aliidongia sp.]|nr:oligosaccharide flippase family protein [Aliidongia sp.]